MEKYETPDFAHVIGVSPSNIEIAESFLRGRHAGKSYSVIRTRFGFAYIALTGDKWSISDALGLIITIGKIK